MRKHKIKLYSYTLLLIGNLLFSSCGEDFLTQYPQDKITAGSFYKSDAEFVAAVNGVYDAMIRRNESEFIAMLDMATPFADCGGEFRLNVYQIRQTNGVIAIDDNYWGSHTFWPVFYDIVSRANNVLDNVDIEDSKVTDEIRNRSKGEALFLRAYAYFNLVQLFGDVPLVLGYIPYEELQQPRTEKEFVYQQIIKDLNEASELLPSVKAYRGTKELGRASKGAAIALLGKTYLYLQDWINAEKTFDKVIKSGDYKLEPYFVDMFWPDNENGIESIFEVQYNSSDPGGGDDRNRWPQYAGFAGGSNTYWSEGWNYVHPTEYYCDKFETITGYNVTSTFVEKFENPVIPLGVDFEFSFDSNDPNFDSKNPYSTRDPRFKWTAWYDDTPYIEEDYKTRGNCPDANYNRSYSFATNHSSVKYMTGKVSPQDESDMNMIVIRYADVLLMAAEAKLEQNKLADAVSLINQVRKRPSVNMPTVQEVSAVQGINISGNPDNLREYLRDERYRELAFEWGHMYYDQLRWEIFDDEMEKFWNEGRNGWEHPAFQWEDKWWLWPIPSDEFGRNENMTQNLGY